MILKKLKSKESSRFIENFELFLHYQKFHQILKEFQNVAEIVRKMLVMGYSLWVQNFGYVSSVKKEYLILVNQICVTV